MKTIPLKNSDSLTAIVDRKDYEFLSQFSWFAKESQGSPGRFYAARNVTVGNHVVTVRMHRLITEADADQKVFFINDDTLDCRRANLQLRTINPWTGRASGFRGVHQIAYGGWRAEVTFAGQKHLIGTGYSDPEEAALAYDAAARRLFGSAAMVNFPK